MFTLLVVTSYIVWSDGVYFQLIGESHTTSLAQIRQEVLMAVQTIPGSPMCDLPGCPPDPSTEYKTITYVLRSYYTGDPSVFAWVIPLPVIPTDLVAHDDPQLFEALQAITAPRFVIETIRSSNFGIGFGCSLSPNAINSDEGKLVEVEAGGQAGIFEYVVLSSSGSEALLDWLNANGFAVPATANESLQEYIDQECYFLALRISDPGTISEQGRLEIPPIQFTCRIDRPWYPMAISRISAAPETEVLIYLLADTRMQVVNAAEGMVNPDSLRYDPSSESLTNYEMLFTQTLAQFDSPAMIVEYSRWTWMEEIMIFWPLAPANLPSTPQLTRLRTVLTPDQMDRDFLFDSSPSADWIDSTFHIRVSQATAQPDMAIPALGIFGFFGLIRRYHRRRKERTSIPTSR